jgi:YesN/AraC family two-component response regulator
MDKQFLSFLLNQVARPYSHFLAVKGFKEDEEEEEKRNISFISSLPSKTIISFKGLTFYSYKELLLWTELDVKDSPFVIISGPFIVYGQEASSVLASFNQKERQDWFPSYLSSLKQITFLELYQLQMLLEATVNHQEIKEEDFLPFYQEHLQGKETVNQEAETLEKEGEAYGGEDSYNFEQKLLYGIKEGTLNDFSSNKEKIFKERSSFYNVDKLRHLKDRALATLTLISRKAIEGGMGVDASFFLYDIYVEKIEQASQGKEVEGIITLAIQDYLSRVRSYKDKGTYNPTVARARIFIAEHVRQKLTTQIISKSLHLSSSYLSATFKKETGQSIPEYVNRKKVEEAEKLLKYTSKPLEEISEYLCFSSQSYFQNTFKKYKGLTPKKCRQSGNHQ